MSREYPILLNHDPDKVIGKIARDGLGEFYVDVTREQLFEALGDACVRICVTEVRGDVHYVKAFELLGFSLVTTPGGIKP